MEMSARKPLLPRRVLDLPKSSNTMEYELTDFITAIDGIDNVKEEIWETPAGRHELGHYRDVTLVSLRIMDAVRQPVSYTHLTLPTN